VDPTNEVLGRQTAKVEELLVIAKQEPTRGSLQALASIYLARGETLTGRGEAERAADDFREAAALYAHLAVQEREARFVDGMCDAGARHRAALETLGQAEEADRHLLGECQLLLHLGEHQPALRALEPVVERLRADEDRFPLFVEAARLHAAALATGGRVDESIARIEALVDALGARGEAGLAAAMRTEQAIALAATGRREEALAALDRSIAHFDGALEADRALLPAALQALRIRAALLLEGDRADEAIPALDRALAWARAHGADAVEPVCDLLRERARAALALGRLDEAQRDVDEACAQLQQVVDREPSMERIDALMEAGFERAVVRFQRRDFDAALQEASGLIAAWAALARRAPGRIDLQQRILMALDLRERAASELGRHQEALADQTRVVDGLRALLEAGAPRDLAQALVLTLERRAGTRRLLGDHARAAEDLAEARRLALA